jgi:hypothetical protein
MKTKNNGLQIFTVCVISLVVFSCAPKKSGVRASVKSTQTNLNPAVSSVAEQQATAQNAIYKISSISIPTDTDAGVTVSSELLNPSNQYLPITTSHENGAMNSQGVFNDSARGLQVHVDARCSADGCYKYQLLVTVVRNNQAVFQSAAISFKNDCSFKSISVGSNAGQMFRSMDEFESKYSNVAPAEDIDSCLE